MSLAFTMGLLRNHIFTGKDIDKPYEKGKTNYKIQQTVLGFSARKEEVLVIAAYFDLTHLWRAYRPNSRIGYCPVHLHPLLAR